MTQTLGLPSIADDPGSRRRLDRLTAARLKGSHTKDEWKVLHGVFEACVCCGTAYSDLHGGAATKDHIQAVSRDGCDCIANLQPLCRNCNSSGCFGDMRDTALPGWQTIYLHRMGSYF